ncbi:MAG TPA: SLC13 family permease [Thermogutta sp.]|nr:SLC13 family permease [Thermogutta sp.]
MFLSPMLVLLIGVALVILLIVVVRVNAFLALIAAAFVVSLLSPGAWDEKVARAVTEFGTTAGKIGVMIALAAIIGKCLMDSGAAERIVRTCLRLIGESRAPVALMTSGFVLSIPVFFDTVFYLLVPLARSLSRMTKSHYSLSILAIGTGAALTHTLVPPTPGPWPLPGRWVWRWAT